MKVRLDKLTDPCLKCWYKYNHDFDEDLPECQSCSANIYAQFVRLLAYKAGRCRFCKLRTDDGGCVDGGEQILKCSQQPEIRVNLQAIVDEYGIETIAEE